MASLLTPARRYGTELLDGTAAEKDEELVLRTISDIGRANALLGGARAAVAELRRMFPLLGTHAILLDVGTGLGDVPRRAQRAAARYGVSLRTIGLDSAQPILRHARPRLSHTVCADALSLPLASRSVDVAMCSQTLHHFRGAAAAVLLCELQRVARVGVVVSDLRRSWIAAGGFWAVSFPLVFHRVTRHDGVVSVLRGYTPAELTEIVRSAVGVTPDVHRRAGFRITASWRVPA